MNTTYKGQFLGGVLFGLLGITLIFFSIKVTDTTIMDLRNFAVIIAILYGGWVSGVTAGIMIIIARIFINGVNISSITAVITIILLVMVCSYISRLNITIVKKFIYSIASNIIIVFSAFTFLVKDTEKLMTVLTYYGAISLFGGVIMFYISEYVARSNENYRFLKESAERDFLTGLNNVRQFDAIWNTHVQNAIDREERLSILLIDIDHFKHINDTYGHPVGDIVLKELGKVLIQSTRSFDTVSRNGGEEFSIILPDCPNSQARDIAERVRKAVEKHTFNVSSSQSITITVSIGVATYPDTDRDINSLIEQADEYLYKAKRTGRNKVCSAD
ncbi:GGDEF domain-containing protein [Bacillus pinisoli]|uniref:GGDEF domain-containing protein n=1 Tax=Bacillus pinisoli TaxID=2901866 RepID=UPI001FF4F822|nr:GGDEF domain-containing protein [Bacillus pinisoli]